MMGARDCFSKALTNGLLAWAILGEPAWLQLDWYGWGWVVLAVWALLVGIGKLITERAYP